MGHLLMAAAAVAMLAVAGHCLQGLAGLLRGRRRGVAQEALHVAMAATMAAMFLGLVSGALGTLVLVGFVAAAIWAAADLVLRRGATARLCVSCLAMAVMAWAMTRPAGGASAAGPGSGAGSGMGAMPGMSMPGPGSTSSAWPLASALIWVSLIAMAALTLWSLRGRRARETVMGASMVLMLGSMA